MKISSLVKSVDRSKLLTYIRLHFIIFLYSLGGICSKLAGQHEFFSFEFIFFYGLVLLDMAVYALLWQQILKKLPLNVAFPNKAVTLFWGMLWGAIFFQEQITVTNIIGAVIVLIGVILMVTSDE